MNFDDSGSILSGSIDIDAPPEKIWALLTSTDTMADWYDGAIAVTQLHPVDSFDIGSRFVLTDAGNVRWCVVTAMEPMRRLCWAEERDGSATVFVEFRLKALSDSRTRLTHTKAEAQ